MLLISELFPPVQSPSPGLDGIEWNLHYRFCAPIQGHPGTHQPRPHRLKPRIQQREISTSSSSSVIDSRSPNFPLTTQFTWEENISLDAWLRLMAPLEHNLASHFFYRRRRRRRRRRCSIGSCFELLRAPALGVLFLVLVKEGRRRVGRLRGRMESLNRFVILKVVEYLGSEFRLGMRTCRWLSTASLPMILLFLLFRWEFTSLH